MKKRVDEWLNFAAEDLKVAQLCLDEQIYNQACFHAQQSVEKSLKAIIEKHGKVPRLHHLIDLLVVVSKNKEIDFNKQREDFEYLDKFYTITRYPFIAGMLPEGLPSRDDAQKAVNIACQINKKVVEYLS